MTTQLRLVEGPKPEPRRPAGRRARVSTPRSRRARWATDWRLDDRTRRTGREGVAAARQALAQARRPAAGLPRAS